MSSWKVVKMNSNGKYFHFFLKNEENDACLNIINAIMRELEYAFSEGKC